MFILLAITFLISFNTLDFEMKKKKKFTYFGKKKKEKKSKRVYRESNSDLGPTPQPLRHRDAFRNAGSN